MSFNRLSSQIEAYGGTSYVIVRSKKGEIFGASVSIRMFFGSISYLLILSLEIELFSSRGFFVLPV